VTSPLDAPSLDTASLGGLATGLFDDEALPTLEAYIRVPCLSPNFDASWEEHGHMARAARMLADWARARPIPGMTVELLEPRGRTPLILCEIPASPGCEGAGLTVLYGHLDKQPPLGAWREGLDPFVPVREGDVLYGRGAGDDGYSIFTALLGVQAGLEAGGVHGRCVVLIEASEESGSVDLDAHLEELAGRIGEPSLVICLDSGCATYDRLWVTTSLRGIVMATLRVEVLHEGVHSGAAGGAVPSSFRILRQLLSRIEDEATGEIRLPELHVPIPAERVAEMSEVEAELGEAAGGSFPTVDGLVLAGETPAERLANRTWRPALAFIGIEGVPAIPDAGNVLRPWTAARLSIRIPPTCDAGAALAAVHRAVTTDVPSGARVQFEGDAAGGWNAPATAPWLAAALSSASEAYFGAEPRSIGEGGSIPFLGSLAARFPDAQFLATGVLGPGSNAHGVNEALHLPTARALTAVVGHVLDAAARAGAGAGAG
jgi:acetylornithine deacetylase/succinyl-diaminopimelate desuccinylase-like protein